MPKRKREKKTIAPKPNAKRGRKLAKWQLVEARKKERKICSLKAAFLSDLSSFSSSSDRLLELRRTTERRIKIKIREKRLLSVIGN